MDVLYQVVSLPDHITPQRQPQCLGRTKSSDDNGKQSRHDVTTTATTAGNEGAIVHFIDHVLTT